MSRALRNGRGRTAVAGAYAHESAQAVEHASRPEQLADFRAFLFRLNPTHTNLTAWADAYAQIPEDGAR